MKNRYNELSKIQQAKIDALINSIASAPFNNEVIVAPDLRDDINFIETMADQIEKRFSEGQYFLDDLAMIKETIKDAKLKIYIAEKWGEN